MNASPYQFILVTQRGTRPLDDYLEFIHTCATAGITSVQLREKNQPFDEHLSFGKALKSLLDPLNIPLIVNDDVKLAHVLNASGVHIGQSDGAPIHARELLGFNKIIGVSIDTPEQLLLANELPVDYVGIGAVFPTKNKLDVKTHWGLKGLKEMCQSSKHPVVAIGGIDENNTEDVLSCGADGIAVIGALHDAQSPSDITKKIREMIRNRK